MTFSITFDLQKNYWSITAPKKYNQSMLCLEEMHWFLTWLLTNPWLGYWLFCLQLFSIAIPIKLQYFSLQSAIVSNLPKYWRQYNMVLSISIFISGCSFPREWEGVWFQSTVRPYITIEGNKMRSKGLCHIDRGGGKFIVKRYEICVVTIAFHNRYHFIILDISLLLARRN